MVHGGYKLTYNWGVPHCRFMMGAFPSHRRNGPRPGKSCKRWLVASWLWMTGGRSVETGRPKNGRLMIFSLELIDEHKWTFNYGLMIVGLFTFSFPTREMNCRLGLISFFARGKVMISLSSGAARSPAFRALRAGIEASTATLDWQESLKLLERLGCDACWRFAVAHILSWTTGVLKFTYKQNMSLNIHQPKCCRIKINQVPSIVIFSFLDTVWTETQQNLRPVEVLPQIPRQMEDEDAEAMARVMTTLSTCQQWAQARWRRAQWGVEN